MRIFKWLFGPGKDSRPAPDVAPVPEHKETDPDINMAKPIAGAGARVSADTGHSETEKTVAAA